MKKASLLSVGRSLATEATPASIADSFRALLADSSDAYSAARSCIVGSDKVPSLKVCTRVQMRMNVKVCSR